MALTEALRLVIDSKVDGAVRGLKSIEKELDLLEADAKKAGVAFDRVGERSARLGGLEKGIESIAQKTGLSTERVKQLGFTVGTAAGALTVALGVKSVQAASDLNEQLSRSNVVFGDAKEKIQQFANSAGSIGLTDRAALQAASSFGTLFVNIGQTQEASAQMSEKLVRLAVDLASFSHTNIDDALQAIQSGLNGEQEPLRRFGVFLSDATLRQEALKQGLISTTSQALTPTQRSLAAYQQILGQTGLAQGDFARTSGTLANQQKVLGANIGNLEEKLGSALIPAVTRGVSGLNSLFDVINTKLIPGMQLLKREIDLIPKAITITIETATKGTPLGALAGFYKDIADKAGIAGGKTEDATTSTDKLAVKARLAALEEKQLKDQLAGTSAALLRVAGAIPPVTAALAPLGQQTNNVATAFGNLTVSIEASARAAEALRNIGRDLEGNQVLLEGPGSHAPAAQVNEVLLSFGEGLARFRAGLEDATAGGVGAGLNDAQDDAAALADYLQAVMRDRIEKLDRVFQGIAGNLSLEDAKASVEEAAQTVADLQAQAAGGKQALAAQQSLVGQLALQAVQITPQEQLRIEQAQKDYEDTLARFQGLATQTANAPASSFLGPATVSVAGPKASLAELQVAEENLAKAKADAIGPTSELEEAQRKLDDLRKAQQDLPKKIADAERDLFKAKADLVEAERRQIDNGQALLDQGPEQIELYKQIGLQAGLSAGDVNALASALVNAKRAAAASQGLVDVFGNGLKFATPDEANAILSYISGINGGGPIKKFAGGGYVGGREGAPQLAVVHGGELVLNRSQQAGWGGVTIQVNGAGDPETVAERVYQKFAARMGRNGSLGLN